MAKTHFRFLSGDVNWADYGGKWYRRVGLGCYHILELINMKEACGKDAEYPYHVELCEIDLLATPESQIASAYKSYGWDGSEDFLTGKGSELAKVECLHGYGHRAPLWDRGGTNVRLLLREAKAESSALDDPARHEQAMNRPVNAIGSTAREYAQGDLHAALVRGVSAGDETAKLVAKIHGVSEEGLAKIAMVPAAQSTVAFSICFRPSNSARAVPSDDPLAYAMGYMHAISGAGLADERDDLAPEYIKGYHFGIEVKTGKAERPSWAA